MRAANTDAGQASPDPKQAGLGQKARRLHTAGG